MKAEIFLDFLYDLHDDYDSKGIIEQIESILNKANLVRSSNARDSELQRDVINFIETLESFSSNRHFFNTEKRGVYKHSDLVGIRLANQLRLTLLGPLWSAYLVVSVFASLKAHLSGTLSAIAQTLDLIRGFDIQPFYQTTEEVEVTYLHQRSIAALGFDGFRHYTDSVERLNQLINRSVGNDINSTSLIAISTTAPAIVTSTPWLAATCVMAIINFALNSTNVVLDIRKKSLEISQMGTKLSEGAKEEIEELYKAELSAINEKLAEQALESIKDVVNIDDEESRAAFKAGSKIVIDLVASDVVVFRRDFDDNKDAEAANRDDIHINQRKMQELTLSKQQERLGIPIPRPAPQRLQIEEKED